MVWPILISVSVTPGAYFFCAAAGRATASDSSAAAQSSWLVRIISLPVSVSRYRPAVNGAAAFGCAGVRRSQNLEHSLGRTPQSGAVAAHHDRPLDDDRVLHHAGDELGVGEAGLVEPRLGRLLLAQQLAWREAEQLEEALQLGRVGRGLQVFDDARLHAARLEQRQRLARLVAARIVIDGDRHDALSSPAARQPRAAFFRGAASLASAICARAASVR